ncbi:MAG: hypothetical protein Q8N26_30535 [Myxococcales bacterium]|nr:hypothetical protein [Myxococcales bacterium]
MRGFGIVGVVVAVVSGCGPATSGPCVAEALTTAAVAGGKTLAPFSCWTADREINVSDGTLAIGEGVTITFAQNASLRVTGQGRLRAVGTAATPIVLRGQDDRRGAWKGVGVSTDATDNRLEHVQLTGAGNAAWTGNNDSKAALFVDDVGGLALVATRISKSAWYGVFTEGAASRIGPFTGVRFDDNERIARLHANTAGAFGGDTTFDGNSESAKAAVYVDNNSSLALDTVTIGSSAGYGLHLVSATNSQASCTAVTFEASNASGPISIARMAAMACP